MRAVLVAWILLGAAAAGAQTLSCPARLGSKVEPGWRVEGSAGADSHAFQRISVYNKDARQEYDLAPDDEKRVQGRIVQTWRLKDYRALPLFLRCRFAGTEATLTRELPKALQSCEFRFRMDKKGNIITTDGAGKPEVKCQ
jgi:hypothetical protein